MNLVVRITSIIAAGLLALATVTSGVAAQQAAPPATAQRGPSEKPARVIIFHMDSLLPDAPERLNLRNWLSLAEEGTRVREMTTVLPYHPTVSGYFPLSTTSLPNPTTAAGSLFLIPPVEETYIQHRFKGPTAFIAGSTAYRSISEGFGFVQMSNDLTDEQVVEAGLRHLREQPDLAYIRLILQDANGAIQRVGFTRDNVPWRGDAYGEGSPYVAAVRRADELLGRFVAELMRMGKYDDTLLVLMPDGAARSGWHGIQQEESWRLPFAMRGPGIARGRTVAYAENIDVAPTIAAVMGLEAPNSDGASGRIMSEVFANSDGRPPAEASARRMERLNRQHKEYLRLTGWMLAHAEAYPLLDISWMGAQNTYAGRSRFWDLSSIDEWPQAGSFDRMLADNEATLTYLRQALRDSGAPPVPKVN